jgi:hypothetical protein
LKSGTVSEDRDIPWKIPPVGSKLSSEQVRFSEIAEHAGASGKWQRFLHSSSESEALDVT